MDGSTVAYPPSITPDSSASSMPIWPMPLMVESSTWRIEASPWASGAGAPTNWPDLGPSGRYSEGRSPTIEASWVRRRLCWVRTESAVRVGQKEGAGPYSLRALEKVLWELWRDLRAGRRRDRTEERPGGWEMTKLNSRVKVSKGKILVDFFFGIGVAAHVKWLAKC